MSFELGDRLCIWWCWTALYGGFHDLDDSPRVTLSSRIHTAWSSRSPNLCTGFHHVEIAVPIGHHVFDIGPADKASFSLTRIIDSCRRGCAVELTFRSRTREFRISPLPVPLSRFIVSCSRVSVENSRIKKQNFGASPPSNEAERNLNSNNVHTINKHWSSQSGGYFGNADEQASFLLVRYNL